MTLLGEIAACSDCRLCAGAAYQAPPALYVGSQDAKIIVIAQNPGEIHAKDSFRSKMAEMMLDYVNDSDESAQVDPRAIEAWYRADFVISPANTKMAEIFGESWVESGNFLYTNAVLCRTVANGRPSDEMISKCFVWTRILAYRSIVKAFVLVGKVAVEQILGEKASRMPVNTIVRHSDSGKLMLYVPHYVTWKSDDIKSYKDTFNTLVKAIGGFDED